MPRKARFIFEDKIVNTMDIYDGQELYSIHIQTGKVEQVPTPYKETAVMFDKDYHYCAALSHLRAFNKFKKWRDNEANQQSHTDKTNEEHAGA